MGYGQAAVSYTATDTGRILSQLTLVLHFSSNGSAAGNLNEGGEKGPSGEGRELELKRLNG
jgi:hypothetical protein